jgi:hypothetical protein
MERITIFSKVFGAIWKEDRVGQSFTMPIHRVNRKSCSWTTKTAQEIREAKWEDLNMWEQISQRHLQANPDMTIEEAGELLKIIPY